MTDLGHVFEELGKIVPTLDGIFIESNYDPEMLDNGSYPEFLKNRIKGPGGHLSNIEAAELLGKSVRKLKWACLAHLSENNNHPHIALQTHRKFVSAKLKLYIASRYLVSKVLTIS